MTRNSRPIVVAKGQSAADSVYEHIKGDIVIGDLSPGVLLDEISLANRFGVSRTPVREALRRLEQDSLVITIPRRGTLVRAPTLQDLVEVDQIRILLEPVAARLAAGRINADALARVSRDLEELRRLKKGDVVRFLQTDRAIHDLVLQSSGNMLMREMVNKLHDRLSAVRRRSSYPRMKASIEELRALIEALRVGDGEMAERVMRDHLRAARDNRSSVFASEPIGSKASK